MNKDKFKILRILIIAVFVSSGTACSLIEAFGDPLGTREARHAKILDKAEEDRKQIQLHRESSRNEWVGRSIDDLTSSKGAPTKSHKRQDGGYQYEYRKTWINNDFWGNYSSTGGCTDTFFTNKQGIVQSWKSTCQR